MIGQTRRQLLSIGYRLLWIYNDRSVGREPYAPHTTGIAEPNYNTDHRRVLVIAVNIRKH